MCSGCVNSVVPCFPTAMGDDDNAIRKVICNTAHALVLSWRCRRERFLSDIFLILRICKKIPERFEFLAIIRSSCGNMFITKDIVIEEQFAHDWSNYLIILHSRPKQQRSKSLIYGNKCNASTVTTLIISIEYEKVSMKWQIQKVSYESINS
jgi:hypothetical protein